MIIKEIEFRRLEGKIPEKGIMVEPDNNKTFFIDLHGNVLSSVWSYIPLNTSIEFTE